MSITPKGPIDHPLGSLSPDQFEALVYLLARDEFPGAVRIRAKDHGLDARTFDPGGATLRGWQAKRFTGAINWGQCQESMRRAAAFWRPLRVTFAFPKILSGKEQDDFRSKLIDGFPRVRIDWWGLEELQARIRDTEGGQRAAAWLFDNLEGLEEKMRRAIATGGELADSAQAAERIAEIHAYVDRDPHLRYTIVAADEDAPQTPPASQTIISIEATFGTKRVRFDASERYPGASADAELGGRLIVGDDAEGEAALAAIERAAKSGEAVKISAGLAADFGKVPVGLRGLVPDGPRTGTFELIPLPSGATSGVDHAPRPGAPGMPFLIRCGEVELGIVLAPAPAEEDAVAELVGSVGGLELSLRMLGAPGEEKIDMGWRWTSGEGTASEQLLAAQLLLAADREAEVEIFDPRLDAVVVSMTLDPVDDPEERTRELEEAIAYLDLVGEAEAWIGEPLRPPAVPGEGDGRALSELLGRIRNPEISGTWERVEMTLTAETDLDKFVVAVIRPVYVPLFGRTYYAGGELVRIPEAQFADPQDERPIGATVAIVPGEDDSVSVLFEPPAQAPEAALRRE